MPPRPPPGQIVPSPRTCSQRGLRRLAGLPLYGQPARPRFGSHGASLTKFRIDDRLARVSPAWDHLWNALCLASTSAFAQGSSDCFPRRARHFRIFSVLQGHHSRGMVDLYEDGGASPHTAQWSFRNILRGICAWKASRTSRPPPSDFCPFFPSLMPCRRRLADPPAPSPPPARRPEASNTILFELRAHAPASGFANGAAAASGGVGVETLAAAAVVRWRPRVVVRAPFLSPQVVEGRLPARHARRAARQQACVHRARLWRRRRLFERAASVVCAGFRACICVGPTDVGRGHIYLCATIKRGKCVLLTSTLSTFNSPLTDTLTLVT